MKVEQYTHFETGEYITKHEWCDRSDRWEFKPVYIYDCSPIKEEDFYDYFSEIMYGIDGSSKGTDIICKAIIDLIEVYESEINTLKKTIDDNK